MEIEMDPETNHIIPATPQKTGKRMRVMKKGGKKQSESSVSMHKYQKLYDFNVVRNDPKIRKYERQIGDTSIKNKCPFIFYELKEILKWSEYYQPTNPNIRTLGIYTEENMIHSLIEPIATCFIQKHVQITLDIKLLSSIPAIGSAIEIYGFIMFSTICRPLFVVKFWINRNTDINKYLKLLEMQKQHMPACYKTLMRYEQNSLISKHEADYYFEEIDESCLNNNVEYLEQICYETLQNMSISID